MFRPRLRLPLAARLPRRAARQFSVNSLLLQRIPKEPPPTKEQLLSRANNVLDRTRIRLKWLLKKSNRPFNTDDWLAFFSWLVVGNALVLIVATTSFVLLVIFTANTVFAQEFVARKLGEFITKNSKLLVTFEHAIVPGWSDGRISFKKCFVSRRPQRSNRFSKSSQADAARESAGDAADDGNYTQFDLTIEEVNISLSFTKWVNGTGIVDEMEIKGIRGVVDRTHVHWDPDDDARNYKNVHQFGDFEFGAFRMEDVLFTLLQPAGFRPFDVAIYNCELEKLRKHWLFYDFLNATVMSGLYDNSLFTVHKRQRLNDYAGWAVPWQRVTRLRVDLLSIDHLNKGLEGPFGWITSGKVDMTGDVIISEEKNSDMAELMAKLTRQQRHEDDKLLVLDLTMRLSNVRALVPFQSAELSYVNYALIRPIVAYINLRNAFIEIHSRVVKNIEDFSGLWTVYDLLLMDDISERVYDSFVDYVADDEARFVRMRKVAFWSMQLLVQFVVFGLGTLT